MPGLMRGIARTAVVAGTATAVSGRVSRRQQGRWAQQEQQEQAVQEPEAQPVYSMKGVSLAKSTGPLSVESYPTLPSEAESM